MSNGFFRRLRTSVETLFVERHIYIRSAGKTRRVVLSPGRQLAVAGAGAAIGAWTGLSLMMMLTGMAAPPRGLQAQHARAYERLLADSRKQLAHDGVPTPANVDAYETLARTVEQRHDALVKLYASVACRTQAPVAAPPGQLGSEPAPRRLRAVQADQDRLIAVADAAAKTCAERERKAILVAGLNPRVYSPTPNTVVPPPTPTNSFSDRVRHAFAVMSRSRRLADATVTLPFGRPTDTTERSSGFGLRRDPITGQNSNHPGVDFPAPRLAAVYATAPGVVAFTGVRQGYGNTVEIDHGRGVSTRFAHLAAFLVKAGERVTDHQKIGAIGSTGRSTGPHLHYEVLVDGRPRNPEHFLKAGDIVHQAG